MALNIAKLMVICLLVDWLFRRGRIPGLVGMLLVGIALGPDALNPLPPEPASVSSDLRRLARWSCRSLSRMRAAGCTASSTSPI